MNPVKEEIVICQADSLTDDSYSRDDDEENFILPSQQTSERSVAVGSPTCSTPEAYLVATAVDESIENDAPRSIVNETVQNIIDETLEIHKNDTPAEAQCDDLFNSETEPYLINDSSLVEATPFVNWRPLVPETPAMIGEDSEDDSFIKTPHLTMARLVTQSQKGPPPPSKHVGTASQLADTQPVLTGSKAVPEGPETIDETAMSTDSSIEELKEETAKEEDMPINGNGSVDLENEKTEEKMIEKSPSHEKIPEDENLLPDIQKNLSSLNDRTLSAERFQPSITPTVESDTEKATEPAPTPQENEDQIVSDVNGERIVAPLENDLETFIVTFQMKSLVQYDKATKKILQQKFVDVKAHVETGSDGSEVTDKSKGESLSSAGSVYSDKQDLPFKLKARVSLASNQTSSTSTVEDNSSEHINGSISSLDEQIITACQNALTRHLQRGNSRLKQTPYSRLSRASKVLFEKIQNSSFDGSSREQSIDEKVQAGVKLVSSEIKTPAIMEEEADTVPPLPLVKSTPKRTRRPLRTKVRGKLSAAKSNKSLESETVEPAKLPVETVVTVQEPDSENSAVHNEPVTKKKRDVSSETVKEKKSPKKAVKKKSSNNTKTYVPALGLLENTSEHDQESSTAPQSDKSSVAKKGRKLKSLDKIDESTYSQESSNFIVSEKSITESKTRKRPAKTEANIAEAWATPGPSGIKKPKVTSQKKEILTEISDVSVSSASEESSTGTGKKRGRGRGKVTDAPTTPTRRPPRRSNTPPSSSELQAGTPVFARWSDNFFYRGSIVKATGDKWEVLFEDGNKKVIASHFVVGLNLLREGHTVMVKSKDTYSPALIISLHSRDEYTLEIGGSEKTVKAKELGLTAEQAKTVLEDQPSAFSTPSNQTSRSIIDPDNIVSERRRGLSLNSSLEPAGSVKRKRKKSPIQYELTLGLDTDETVSEANAPVLLNAKKAPKSRKNLQKNEDLEKKLGPIPTKPIFEKMCFLLCEVTVKVKRPNKRVMKATTDSEVSMSESEDANAYDKYEKFPFQADWLKKQIIAGGGMIYDRFEDVPVAKHGQTRLVTNRPNRSAKFLLCLVHGIDIVLHLHIIEACRGQELKSMKLHHAGWSLSTRRWMDRSEEVNKTFSGRQICVNIKCENAGDEKRVHAFWNIILKKAGANLVDQVDYADIIVTDNSIPDTVREVLNALGDSAPLLVSPNWVIESIIHGNPVEQSAHASFLHDFDDKESSS